jgi:2-keto-4-pentenoate hydratase/2-oxohepta-3-ene-1,7-dioic acid hydratase in catechol pathway
MAARRRHTGQTETPMIWARMQMADGAILTGHLADGWLTPCAGLGQERALGAAVSTEGARFLAPTVPGRFVGLWNNFHAAAQRNGWTPPQHPLYFLKDPGSLADPGSTVAIAPDAGRVIFEGELGIVIARPCHRATPAEAEAAILGYCCVNDLTALDILFADPAFGQWTRAKGMPGFGPIGPVVATGLDWRSLTVRTLVNGRERQAYEAADMILPPAEIVRLLSHDMALAPGDVIACGTSLGARPVRPGDLVEVVIDGIGTLAVTLAEAA